MVASKRSGYLVAAIGALIAFFAFFFLPYAVAQVFASAPATTFDSTNSTFKISSVPLFSQNRLNIVISGSVNSTDLARVNVGVWLIVVVAIVLAALAILLAFKGNPFGMSTTSIDRQLNWGAILLIGLAIVGILMQIGIFNNVAQIFQNAFPADDSAISGTGYSSTQYAVSFGSGAWIFLIGMAIVIAGATSALFTKLPVQAPEAAIAPAQPFYPPAPGQYHAIPGMADQYPSVPFPPVGAYPQASATPVAGTYAPVPPPPAEVYAPSPYQPEQKAPAEKPSERQPDYEPPAYQPPPPSSEESPYS